MDRPKLLKVLTDITRDEFNNLVFLLNASKDLPGENVAQASRATALLEWVEAKNKLPELDKYLKHTNVQDGTVVNLPLRNCWFEGRTTQLQEIHDWLKGGQATMLLYGLGGIGKTQLATEYGYQFKTNFQVVIWVNADTSATLTAGYVTIASQLELPSHQERDQERMVQEVKTWLQQDQCNYLLILDNADEPEILRPFLPPKFAGALLITSRASFIPGVNNLKKMNVTGLHPDDAAQVLLKRNGGQAASLSELVAAHKLAEELHFFPLALEQAAGYIAAQNLSIQKYLDQYQVENLSLLKDSRYPTDNEQRTIFTTWNLNLEKVRANPVATEILFLSAFLHPDDIPFELLTNGATSISPALDAALKQARFVNEVLFPLTRYSLVTINPESQTYSIHRLVQHVIQADMDDATKRTWAEQVIRLVNQAFPNVEFTNWPQCARLLAQALQAAALGQHYDLKLLELACLLNKIGSYLYEYGRYTEAKPLYLEALKMRREGLPTGHPDIAISLNNLAALYDEQGQYTETELLYNEALEIFRKEFPVRHLHIANSFNNLAVLYYKQGRYAEAESLYKNALEIYRKELPAGHPDIATCLNNLALLYTSQGRYAEAEPMCVEALEIVRKKLPAGHPDIATSLANLAVLYKSQRRYTEAEPLYEEALEIYQKKLPAGHPTIIQSLNNLALFYHGQGRYALAESFYLQAIAILENTPEGVHPNLPLFLDNYAALLRAKLKFFKAFELKARAENIRKELARRNPAKE